MKRNSKFCKKIATFFKNLKSPKYCKKCILRLDEVPHDKDGVCVYCQNYKKNQEPWNAKEKIFEETLKKYIGKGKNSYDVICLLTGGKDSTLSLYLTAKYVPKERILAFTWDHGFHEEQSWKNIRNAVKISGVKHEIFCIGESQENAIKFTNGCYKEFGSPCSICGIYQMIITLRPAFKYEIPLIVAGITPGQGGGFIETPIMETMNEAARIKKIGQGEEETLLKKILENSFSQEDAENIYANLLKPFRDMARKDPNWFPHSMSLGYFFDWNKNEEEVVKMLNGAYGFVKPAETTTHTSCELVKFRGYRAYLDEKEPSEKKKGPGKLQFEIAQIVRSGGITREKGFEDLKKLGICSEYPEEAVQMYLKKTGMARKEFEKYAKWSRKI